MKQIAEYFNIMMQENMKKYRCIICWAIIYLITSTCYSQTKLLKQEGLNLYPVVKNYKDDHMGFVNLSGNLTIPCLYDWVKDFDEGFAVFSKDGKCGLINYKGVIVAEPVYDYLGTMSEGMIVYKKDKKYGYLNSQGKVAISNLYDRANSFSEGLAAVSQNNKYGYINKEGKMVIPQKFVNAYTFREGLAKVILESKQGWLDGGFIDKSGIVVIPCIYYTGNDNTSGEEDGFYGGVARASLDGEKWGYINKKNQFVIKPIFSGASNFKEGLAAVWRENNSRMGYINSTGKEVIKIDFEGGGRFQRWNCKGKDSKFKRVVLH